MKTTLASRALAVLFVCLTACAAESADVESSEGAATAVASREIANLGGAGDYAFAADGTLFFVFDRAIYSVDGSGRQTRLADTPDHVAALTVTPRYVAVATNGLHDATLTFYDRENGYRSNAVALASDALALLPGSGDQVLASLIDDGLVAVSADGATKVAYPLAGGHGTAVRDIRAGDSANVVYGVVGDGGASDARHLIEIDVAAAKSRVVFAIDKGSFTYQYDPETHTFFTERSHRDFPSQSIVALFDANGAVLETLETPLNTSGGVAVDHDAFYLPARKGMSPGTGTWKLLAFDKKTLALSERGRIEPMAARLTIRGDELYYTAEGRLRALRQTR
jgi:hypothetical protein